MGIFFYIIFFKCCIFFYIFAILISMRRLFTIIFTACVFLLPLDKAFGATSIYCAAYSSGTTYCAATSGVSCSNDTGNYCYCSASGTFSCATCTGKPANSSYTSTQGTTNDASSCPWKCNSPYIKDGSECKICPSCSVTNGSATRSSNGTTCSYSITCNTGYGSPSNTCNTNQTDTCSPKKYSVTLNRASGSGGDGSVTVTYNANMPTIIPPKRTNYIFAGYYDVADTGGVKYYKADGTSERKWNKDEGGTLYARWTACPAGTGTNGTVYSTVIDNVCNYYIWCNAKYENTTNNNSTNATTTSTLSCTSCSQGYYCPGGSRSECPVGATTDGPGKEYRADCIMKGGTGGTKFCDSHGCFFLPSDIKYDAQQP